MWRGCIDKEIRWWCVRSWDGIQMVHRSMRNGSRVADELYIKRVLLALEDFLFFSLYSFSCIAKQVTTLKQLRLLSCLCRDFLDTNFERPLFLSWSHIRVTNITYARPRPLQLQASIHQILAACTGKNNSGMHTGAFWKSASTECQQFTLLHICWWRHCADHHIHNRLIECPDRQKYYISKVKHRFRNKRYCKLQRFQQWIIGCWNRDFDMIL